MTDAEPARYKVWFELEVADDYPPSSAEGLWAEATGTAGELMLRNIPFFSFDATLGDVVKVSATVGGELWYHSTIASSGSSLLRVFVFEQGLLPDVVVRLERMGCVVESDRVRDIIAVDVPARVALEPVQQYLAELFESDRLDYEEALLRHAAGRL